MGHNLGSWIPIWKEVNKYFNWTSRDFMADNRHHVCQENRLHGCQSFFPSWIPREQYTCLSCPWCHFIAGPKSSGQWARCASGQQEKSCSVKKVASNTKPGSCDTVLYYNPDILNAANTGVNTSPISMCISSVPMILSIAPANVNRWSALICAAVIGAGFALVSLVENANRKSFENS